MGHYHQQHSYRQQTTLSWVEREGNADFAAFCARKHALPGAHSTDVRVRSLPAIGCRRRRQHPAAEAAFQRLDDRRSEAEMLNEAFTPAEVQQALRKLNSGKAAGLSSAPAELLR